MACSSPLTLFKSKKFWDEVANVKAEYYTAFPDFTAGELDNFMNLYVALFSNPGMTSPPIWVYVPFDPNTGQVPPANEPWPKKEYDANGRRVMVSYSSNLHEYQKNPSIVPVLVVNYHQPIVWVSGWSNAPPKATEAFASLGWPSMPFYTGKTDINDPPAPLPLAWQATLWKAGVMVSREYIPTVHVEDQKIYNELNKILSDHGFPPICKGWYYIGYSANFLDIQLPPQDAERVVVTYYFGVPKSWSWPVVGGLIKMATQGEIIDHINKTMGFVKAVYESAGWAIGDFEYEGVDGKKHKGVAVYLVNKNDKVPAYAVSLPLERSQLALDPELALIAIAIIVIGIAWALNGYFWYKVEMERQKNKGKSLDYIHEIPDDWQKIFNECIKAGGDPNKCAEYATRVTTGMAGAYNVPESSNELGEAAKYIAIGVGGAALLYALLKGLEEYRHGR